MLAATFTGGAGFSVFVQPMADDLGWPRAVLAGALSAGTVVGALVAPLFGRLADRFGARAMLTACGLGIAGTLGVVSTVTQPAVFVVSYGLARAVDMGALNVAVTTAVCNWFVRRRGRALGIAMAGNALGVMALVPIAQWLIEGPGWRAAWLVLGAGSGLVLAVLAALLLRRRPEDLGLRPDGDGPPGPPMLGGEGRRSEERGARSEWGTEEPGTGGRPHRDPLPAGEGEGRPHPDSLPAGEGEGGSSLLRRDGGELARGAGDGGWSVGAAARQPAFWALVAASALGQCAVSGLTTHQVALLLENGVAPAAAAAGVGVYGFAWAVGSVAWGGLAERLPARYALALSFGVVAACAVAVLGVRAAPLVVPYALAYGLANGGKEALDALVWADYFGRQAVGGIRGLSRPFVVGGGALGPLVGGVGYDLTGGYGPVMLLLAGMAALGTLVALGARPPRGGPEGQPSPVPGGS
jgi:MFS family permease